MGMFGSIIEIISNLLGFLRDKQKAKAEEEKRKTDSQLVAGEQVIKIHEAKDEIRAEDAKIDDKTKKKTTVDLGRTDQEAAKATGKALDDYFGGKK